MRFLKSFKHALQGIKQCAISEKNFRLQLIIAAFTFFSGMVFKISVHDWYAIFFCTALVLSLEMINTAIEKLSDAITKSFHPAIKQVKDIAAGAVCLAAVASLITGCFIFIPKLNLLIKHFIK